MDTQTASREEVLLMAMELSNTEWRVRFGTGQEERGVRVEARDIKGLARAIGVARKKLGCGAGWRVVSCYEAGRDGFWLHRCLVQMGVENVVVDSASIEVSRRKRRAKTDRLDAQKLLAMLRRYVVYGERTMWQVVRVPTETQEDERRRHREYERLQAERTSHVGRVRSLLALHGVAPRGLAAEVGAYRDWAQRPLPEGVQAELQRELERLRIVERQIRELAHTRAQTVKEPVTEGDRVTAKLMRVKAIGMETASVLGYEFFGWRRFANRRQVGALAGLTGTPYDSGQSKREQGISKAGNARVRHKMIEATWLWLRFQPQSALTQWFWAHYGPGSKRKRRVGIVAMARKLLVALWKYVQFDEVPVGAILKTV